ncbi:uncharacterized protein [Periplaneta americana]|uniref:uncharacterized protein isoform X2 n=1 Tax=Periplaneta americana TaxID=6978 RepID=UPI0037E71C23
MSRSEHVKDSTCYKALTGSNESILQAEAVKKKGKICQSYAPASSTPSLQSIWIHLAVCGTNWTTGLMSAGTKVEPISSTYKFQGDLLCSKFILSYKVESW